MAVINPLYSCVGKYTFINNGFLKEGEEMTYAEAWKGIIIFISNNFRV